MLLVVDNGSVYTKQLVDFLGNKAQFQLVQYNDVDFSNLSNYHSFILSGRKKNDQFMNKINSKIIKFAIEENKPLLGICYGAEILALTLGGTIKKSKPEKGNELVMISKKNPICEDKIDVFESHNYEISRLNHSLERIAHSNSCENEIIKHKNSNIFGTQFHPEMSKDGKILIEKFCLL